MTHLNLPTWCIEAHNGSDPALPKWHLQITRCRIEGPYSEDWVVMHEADFNLFAFLSIQGLGRLVINPNSRGGRPYLRFILASRPEAMLVAARILTGAEAGYRVRYIDDNPLNILEGNLSVLPGKAAGSAVPSFEEAVMGEVAAQEPERRRRDEIQGQLLTLFRAARRQRSAHKLATHGGLLA